MNRISRVDRSDISFSYIDFYTIKENLVASLNIAEAETGVPVLQASFNGNNALFTRDFLKDLMITYEDYDLELKRRPSAKTRVCINDQVGLNERMRRESSSTQEISNERIAKT